MASGDAWAGTLGPGHNVVEVQKQTSGEPRSRSAEGMCPKSPDTKHWWDLAAVGSQSSERFDCRWCGSICWD